MWLVSGVDEEHRFRDWAEAAGYYRLMVGDWIRTHGDDEGAGRRVEELAIGQSQAAVFPDPDSGGTVEFRIGWESVPVGLDRYGAGYPVS